jgi:GT2 family glycosyltransferase
MSSDTATDRRASGPMQRSPAVWIVVLNWNGIDCTMGCIDSLERQAYANFSIIVVDNGSTDGSRQALEALGARITLLALDENRGYTGGNNIALREAFGKGADYVWLFNSDATAEPDTLAKLVEACEADPTIGLASPVVFETPDHRGIQTGCGIFDLASSTFDPAHELASMQDIQRRHPERIAVHGTAVLVRAKLYRTIGGLDDTFFAYWEDIDYSIRSALAGFHNQVT